MSALERVRIVEWSRHFPAAMAAMHLADQGFGLRYGLVDDGREQPPAK